MHKFKSVIALVLALAFAGTTHAEWTFVTESVDENKVYVDIDRIRENDGYVYVWRLNDWPTLDRNGDMSSKIYMQVDCGAFRNRNLSGIFYDQSMGKGNSRNETAADPTWSNPPPNSVSESTLNFICAQ